MKASNFDLPKLLLKGGFLAALGLVANTTMVSAEPSPFLTLGGESQSSSMGQIQSVNDLAAGQTTASMSQVQSVSQLSDVSPGDWAFEALTNLVERYGCIEGYPNRTFRGNRATTRYEFAAGLNACLNSIERLIANSEAILREDIAALQRLVTEFEAELAALGARVDNLEGRVSFLEDHSFSTTTKLQGEVAFTLAQAFGSDSEAQVVFNDRVRLQLASSFTGKDILLTRLTAGNVGNTFQDEIGGTFEGRFAYDGQFGNNVTIDRLHYYFPVGENGRFYAMANLGGHHFYADTFNPGLDVGGGANGALSRFGERSSIYRKGLGGQGAGFTYNFGDIAQASIGYLARGGSDPSAGAGLFNGNYSAFGQVVIKPTDSFKFGLTYTNNYEVSTGAFAFGATGTREANLLGIGVDDANGVSSNMYGIAAQFDVSDNVSIRAWGNYTSAILIGQGEAEIWTYAIALAFPDLGKEGALGAIIAGAEPYLGSVDSPAADSDIQNDVPYHIEALYRYPLNRNIFITPAVTILTAPNQGNNPDFEDVVVIGALRTTFKF